jgi:hypothetical protein
MLKTRISFQLKTGQKHNFCLLKKEVDNFLLLKIGQDKNAEICGAKSCLSVNKDFRFT